jgi:hypothetical protein
MESIELERGWLARQMQEVRQDVQRWPEVLAPLRTLNASLVHRSSVPENAPGRALTPTTATDTQK